MKILKLENQYRKIVKFFNNCMAREDLDLSLLHYENCNALYGIEKQSEISNKITKLKEQL